MNRRKLREHVFKLVFISAFNQNDEMKEQSGLYFDGLEDSLTDADREACLQRFRGVTDRIPEIDERLNRTARGWKTNRFASCDLAILRLAVYEMLYDDQVPKGVAINEAVELAKQYGGDESPSFVNGILGEIAREI
ncbi:MAG: transcription antitermination factor NusB [Lachnospiraceae bacterium]|nr:transcription antitermination factor NusB [Lachnospiraceae bacterium]